MNCLGLLDYFIRSAGWIEDDLYELLETSPFFEGLSPSDYRQLAELFHESKYSPGERIFSQGDPSSALYFVGEGSVELFRQVGDDRTIDLGTIETGDFFGELALCEGHDRSASARAVEQTTLKGLFRQELREFIWRRQDAGIKILFNLVSVVGNRLYETNDRVESLRTELARLREEPTPDGSPDDE